MMKKFIIFISILAFSLLPVDIFAQSETGGIENVFSYGAGLRALGMGGAFTAIENDATLAYWNPGAMPFNQYKEVSLFGTRSIANSYYFSGFYTHPTVSFGALGLGGIGLYTGGIESYDENASPITGAKTDYLHYQILLSYGYNFEWGMGVGATAKIEQLRITDYKGSGASFDVGIYYNPSKVPWLSAGAVVQDVYGTGIKIADEFEKNTRVYKVGTAANFYLGKKKKTRLTFAVDNRLYTDNYNPGSHELLYDISFGTELSFNEEYMFRTGYRNLSFDSAFQNLPAGISAGMSIRRWGLGIDYAVTFEDSDWQGPVELLMRLGLSYRFGKSIDEKKALEAERVRKKIDEGIKETTQTYENQLDQLTQKYTAEKEQVILDMDEKYKQRVAALDDTIEEARQDIIADLTAQFEAEKQKSLDKLSETYAQERASLELQLIKDRSDYQTKIGEMEKQFEEEKITIKEKLSADEAFKSEYYAKGLQFFSDGQYKDALASFETVSRYDANYLKVQEYIQRSKAEMRDVSTYNAEILNIYYNGIDLFIQKKYEEAIAEWKKILKIDPYNKLAMRNIKEAEGRLRKLKELGISE